MQKKWWILEWVPVTYDGSGDHHVLDLAPTKGASRHHGALGAAAARLTLDAGV